MTRRRRHLERIFPDLLAAGYETHSHQSMLYNCIAYAAGDTDNIWSPDFYWPDGAWPDVEYPCLVDAYEMIGFEICSGAAPEAGYEKVALYAKDDQRLRTLIWTHAARLRPDGWWESKLGLLEDILHRTPDALFGADYGRVRDYMRRPLATRIRSRYER